MTLTNNRVYEACEASFPSWRYTPDLDSGVPSDKDERHPKNGIYAVWFRDCVEADEDLKSLSADMIAAREPKLKTIILLERGLLELVYFMETGRHLDIHNITLCSGSRDSCGFVPNAHWHDGKFKVRLDYRDLRSPRLRSREAVSL